MTPLTKYHDQLRIYKSHMNALESQYRYFKRIGLVDDMQNVAILKRQVRLCRNAFIKISKKIHEVSNGNDFELVCPL